MSRSPSHPLAAYARTALLLLAALAGALLPAASAAGSGGEVGAQTAARVHALAARVPLPPLASSFAQLQAREAARAASRGGHRRKRARKPALRGNPLRALLAFEAMQRYDYIGGSGLYVGDPFSDLWSFSQAMAATVSLYRIPRAGAGLGREIHTRLVGLGSYLDRTNAGEPEGVFTSTLPAFDAAVAPPAGPGGAKFYDDNDWVGIELMRIYELTHDPSALGTAEAIMAFEMSGWQSDPRQACPGGIPFSNAAENGTRNAVTNAPVAELGVQLYSATHNIAYLQFAQMTYEWVRSCLLQPSGLYADSIRRNGSVDPTLWSYNQGTMIGAGALLYQATGNGAFLFQARQTARAALAYYTLERLRTEIPFFPAVFFRNLAYLDSLTHDPPGTALAQSYANYFWQHQRLPHYLFTWGSPPAPQLLVQAAIVQIYALLSSDPRGFF
jgi:hypothetical protein